MNMVLANSNAAKAWRAYQCDAPDETPDAFLERHLPLVRTTVDRMRIYLPPVLEMNDLYSVGITGLISAAQKYDPAQRDTFPAFAMMHIRGAVHDELRRMDWLPRSRREKAKRLQDAIGRVEQREGRAANAEEISSELEISAAEYVSLLEEVRPVTLLPLDGEAFAGDDDEVRLHDIIPDESQASGRDELEKKELEQLLAAQIQTLPDMQKKVLALYYFEDLRLAEIAAVFGVTEGRISQIHTQAVLGLRAFIQRMLSGSAAHSPASSCS